MDPSHGLEGVHEGARRLDAQDPLLPCQVLAILTGSSALSRAPPPGGGSRPSPPGPSDPSDGEDPEEDGGVVASWSRREWEGFPAQANESFARENHPMK